MTLVVLKNIPTLSILVTPADNKKTHKNRTPCNKRTPCMGGEKNLIVPPNKDRTLLPKKLRSNFWGVLILET